MTIPDVSTIVVVEDDPTAGWMMSKLLELLAPSHLVATFTRGEAALAYLKDYAASCVITDYRLPDIDGPDLIADVVKQWPHIPIAIVTGERKEIVQSQLHTDGLSTVPIIEKPITVDQIYTLIIPLLTSPSEKAIGVHYQKTR